MKQHRGTVDFTLSGLRHKIAGVISDDSQTVKYWELIADNLKKTGWSWGCVSALDRQGRTIWIADAHRDDGRRFVVRADERLTAFLELERVTARIIALPKCGIIRHNCPGAASH